jgi:hypothetical protein
MITMEKSVRRFGIPLALAAFSLLWTGGLTMWPRSGDPVAAFFPPWFSPSAALAVTASANAAEIRGFGGWNNVVVAQSDDPAFAQQLRQSGALIVLRASPFTGCVR